MFYVLRVTSGQVKRLMNNRGKRMPPDIPGPEAIRNALEKLVTSAQMESSPSLCRFLRYVVQETLEGRGGAIKEYSLGAEVFGRGDDFDPRIDPIVRVQARNLRARMAKYYEGPGATEAVIIDLPKRTYVPVFSAREAAVVEVMAVEEQAASGNVGLKADMAGVDAGGTLPKKSPARIAAAAILIALAGGALSIPLRPAHRAHVPNSAAQDQYIRGRFLLDRHSEKSLRDSVASFEHAIELDGQFAAAYAGLADASNMLAQYGFVAPPEGMEKARTAAMKSLALDPKLAEAHVSLASVTEAYDWNWAGAEREYREAITLNPALPAAHLWYGMFLRDQGRLDEALPELRMAAQLSPVSELTSINLAYGLMEKGNYSSALEQASLATQLNPGSVSAQLLLANIYRCLARNTEAREALARAEAASEDNPHGLSALVGIYTRNGLQDKGAIMRRKLEELAKQRYVSPFDLANVSLVMGDEDRALELFEEAYRQRSSGMIFLRSRNFAKMRQRDHFQDLVHRMHFAS
jgi:tetratricopeptide (TPR) repeat protein